MPDPAPAGATSVSLPSSHSSSTVWGQAGLPLLGLGTLQKVTGAGCGAHGAVSWLGTLLLSPAPRFLVFKDAAQHALARRQG